MYSPAKHTFPDWLKCFAMTTPGSVKFNENIFSIIHYNVLEQGSESNRSVKK